MFDVISESMPFRQIRTRTPALLMKTKRSNAKVSFQIIYIYIHMYMQTTIYTHPLTYFPLISNFFLTGNNASPFITS